VETKAFICLSQALEVLADSTKRAAYDRELKQRRSQDGLQCTLDHGTLGGSARRNADPMMIFSMFLHVEAELWSKMFSMLTDTNLDSLVKFLGSPAAEKRPHSSPEVREGESASLPNLSTTAGICKSNGKYFAKICFNGMIIRTFRTTDLGDAIDARFALMKVRDHTVESVKKKDKV